MSERVAGSETNRPETGRNLTVRLNLLVHGSTETYPEPVAITLNGGTFYGDLHTLAGPAGERVDTALSINGRFVAESTGDEGVSALLHFDAFDDQGLGQNNLQVEPTAPPA